MDIVSDQQRKKIHPYKFTLWVGIASIVMMFAGLTSAFIVKSNLVGWSDVEIPKIFWYSTAVIIVSSITVQMALRSFQKREMRQYRLLIALTLLLGTLFVIMQWYGFQSLWSQHIRFSGSAGAGQFLYVIFGLHAIHVLGGVVAMVIMFLRAYFGKIKLYSVAPVEVIANYWHFVDILWIYLLIFFIVIG
jgi:cytochrome c oxidase subunit 3